MAKKSCLVCSSEKHSLGKCRKAGEAEIASFAILLSRSTTRYTFMELTKPLLKFMHLRVTRGMWIGNKPVSDPDFYNDENWFQFSPPRPPSQKLSKFTKNQLAQTCYEAWKEIQSHKRRQEPATGLDTNGETSCAICLTEFTETSGLTRTACGHSFCSGCIIQHTVIQTRQHSHRIPCPMCRQSLHTTT